MTNKIKFYAQYGVIGSVFGTLGYYYIRSIVDFREDASLQGIEMRATSDIIWMLFAALLHQLFRSTFRNLFEAPITRLVKKNSKDTNASKTVRQVIDFTTYTTMVIIGLICIYDDPRLPHELGGNGNAYSPGLYWPFLSNDPSKKLYRFWPTGSRLYCIVMHGYQF